MKYNIIYTYMDFDSLKKIQKKYKIVDFSAWQSNKNHIKNEKLLIDITSLVYFLQNNKQFIFQYSTILPQISENEFFIVKESEFQTTKTLFPFLFGNSQMMEIGEEKKENVAPLEMFQRKSLYTYQDLNELNHIINNIEKFNGLVLSFSELNDEPYKLLDNLDKILLMDLTNLTDVIESNTNILYLVEQFLYKHRSLNVIVKKTNSMQILELFPLLFDKIQPIKDLIPGLYDNFNQNDNEDNSIQTVVKVDSKRFNIMKKHIEHNLIGHENFKNRLFNSLYHFKYLNKLHEQKVYSMFLYGPSGIGKTEVARIIGNELVPNGYFPKINFQNYSSQDALNSLIGSPRGYVGSEHGELSEKLQKSKIGILLCDEFEKTNYPVFSFFLELLEDGKFTDSLGREYDLDGYIIIFTSNIRTKKEFDNLIPHEFATRLDLICEFESPCEEDKIKFIDLLIEQKKFVLQNNEMINLSITPEAEAKLKSFEYTNSDSFREIKKQFNDNFIKWIIEQDIEI